MEKVLFGFQSIGNGLMYTSHRSPASLFRANLATVGLLFGSILVSVSPPEFNYSNAPRIPPGQARSSVAAVAVDGVSCLLLLWLLLLSFLLFLLLLLVPTLKG